MTDYEDLLDKGIEEAEDLGGGDRFEMPEVDTRKEGSKTIIVNFSDIASKFGRDEKHFSKYIQNDLGTAGHIDGKELVLNGEFRRGNVQRKIEGYADDYVFCAECSRPDTEIIKEKGIEIMKCQACGSRTPI